MSLGDYLIQKRLQNKLTQDEAAILMYITPNRLSRIERKLVVYMLMKLRH